MQIRVPVRTRNSVWIDVDLIASFVRRSPAVKKYDLALRHCSRRGQGTAVGRPGQAPSNKRRYIQSSARRFNYYAPGRLCPLSVLVQHPSGDGDEGDPRWISRWTTNWRANDYEPSLC